MKSKIEVVGKPKDMGDGKLLVHLQRSLSEDGITWREVETRYILLRPEKLETMELVNAFITEQNFQAIDTATAPPKTEVDVPLLEGKGQETDTEEQLPPVETHPAGPPDKEEADPVLEEGAVNL